MREQNDCMTNRDKNYSPPFPGFIGRGGGGQDSLLGMLTSFIIQKSLIAPRTIFKCYHLGTSMSFAIGYPHRLLFLLCIRNKTEEAFS